MSASYVWGVDMAVSRLAFACAERGRQHVEVQTLITANDATEGERLGLLDRQTRIFAKQLAAEYPPHVAWVEQPSGRHRNLQLAYATGVVQAALFEVLGVPVWTLPSSTWKEKTVGAGNATKPQVAAWAQTIAPFDGQDEADAIGIAVAGRAMVEAGRWDATV